MAARIRYICDLCQDTIGSGRTRIEVTIGTLAGMPTDVATGRTALDLCSCCSEALTQHLGVSRAPIHRR